ncbi:hypothetical protein EV201_1287 [Ancylomarina subtilis]|uniref:Uncharacterized protein n=1 Tax=Ancylomarina subtilis TaxID=1639035 RepID=A0A4Q7VK86_9BACT|nr:hypothetical protein [Ancylomarina subtilis]RZT96646.1 hypothetical protein EV201_1287 [Ancylomarina subtilis]
MKLSFYEVNRKVVQVSDDHLEEALNIFNKDTKFPMTFEEIKKDEYDIGYYDQLQYIIIENDLYEVVKEKFGKCLNL